MLSFWEKKSFLKYDYIIIGSGITGLSTAATLIEENAKRKILVLERGIFPTGASTKNAGFACFGSVSELLSDIGKIGEEKTQELVQLRWEGLNCLRQRLGNQKIDYKNYGGYELIFEKDADNMDKIPFINKLIKPIFKEAVFKLTPKSKIKKFAFNTGIISNPLIFNKFEGQIDTGLMMKNLLYHVQKRGVQVLNGAEVSDIADKGTQVEVVLEGGITFSATKAAVCTNAFSTRLFPELDIQPGRGQVLVTKPIKKLPFKGTFHFDEGFYYFRNFKNRVIFGGGRNMDIKGENTSEIANTDLIIQELERKLREIILPNQDFEIEQFWAGIMAFGTDDKTPILKKHTPNIVIGTRLNGMGVAIGSVLGNKIAGLLNE